MTTVCCPTGRVSAASVLVTAINLRVTHPCDVFIHTGPVACPDHSVTYILSCLTPLHSVQSIPEKDDHDKRDDKCQANYRDDRRHHSSSPTIPPQRASCVHYRRSSYCFSCCSSTSRRHLVGMAAAIVRHVQPRHKRAILIVRDLDLVQAVHVIRATTVRTSRIDRQRVSKAFLCDEAITRASVRHFCETSRSPVRQ